MKKNHLIAIAGSVLLAVACSETDRPVREHGEVTLTVEGVNAAEFSNAMFVLASAEARADGRLVPAVVQTGRANLANPDEKLRLRVEAPPSNAQLEITLVLDDYGAFATRSSAGEIDTRGGRLVIRVPAQAFLAKPTAAVQVDLGRSLFEKRADKRVFLPHYGVSM